FGSKVWLTESRLRRVEDFFRRFGGEVVIVARFVTGARQLNGIVAGIAGMNWWKFLPYNALGGVIWVGFWSVGIYSFGTTLNHLAPWMNGFGIIVAAAVIVGLVVMAVH